MPLIAALLGLPTEGRYPALDLTPQRQKQLTLEALIEQLEGLAAAQPVLLAYEDVHWSDPTTQELLGLTIERVQRLPVLALITYRPEFSPPWAAQPHVSALALSRLGRREGAALVERVVRDKALPDEVAAQIVAKTDGVPLFVEELTKTVLEFGPARGRGRPLRAVRPAAAARDPGDAARLAARPPRSPRPGQGGRPDRRRASAASSRTRCSPRSPTGPSRSCRPPSTSWSRPNWSSAAAPRPRPPTASSTRWSRTPPTAPCSSPAASSCTPGSRGARGAVSRARRSPNPSCSPITDRGWAGRNGSRLLAQGRASGDRALGDGGGDRASDQGPGDCWRRCRTVGARPARTRPADRARGGL